MTRSVSGTTPWSDRVDVCRKQFASDRNDKIREQIACLVTELPVMEVGCGTQRLRRFVGGAYVGVDFTPEFDPDIVADAQELPMPDNDVPVVVTKNVLQHVPDWEAAVSECHRVARERVIHAERTHDGTTTIVADEPVLRRRFNPDEFAAAMHGTVTRYPCEADDRLTIFVGDLA